MDDARALASLGGGHGVSQACSSGRDAPKLLLRSRPSDPLARPLRADRASANGLVLRISRKDPGAGTRNAGVFDAGVSIVSVTRVTHAFRFRQMADYQHTRAAEDPTLAAVSGIAPSDGLASDSRLSGLATTHASDERTNAVERGAANDVTHTIDPTIAYVSVPKGHAFAMPMPDGPASDPFHVAARADAALRGAPPAPRADGSIEHGRLIGGLIAAPPVSSVNHPEDYRAVRWKRARETAARGPGERTGGAADPVPFAVAAVPPALADAEAAEAREALGVPKAAADAIAAAFERRPVWAHDALLEALPAETRGSSAADIAAIEKAFPTFAFRFKDGPFRRLWTRRGYDPRTRARDAKLQCLEMRLDASWFDDASTTNTKGLRNSAARVSRSHRETHGFEALAASATARDRKKPPVATRYPLYQLCDVSLPGVRATLETFERTCVSEEEERSSEKGGEGEGPAAESEAKAKKKARKKCSATFGFFSKARYNRVRACVLAACEAVYRGEDPVRAEAEALAGLGPEEEDDEDRDGAVDEDEDAEEEEEEEEEEEGAGARTFGTTFGE